MYIVPLITDNNNDNQVKMMLLSQKSKSVN